MYFWWGGVFDRTAEDMTKKRGKRVWKNSKGPWAGVKPTAAAEDSVSVHGANTLPNELPGHS